GVSRVEDGEGLDEALRIAFAEDDKVLVESRIIGREIEVGVLAGRARSTARASLPGEVVLTSRGSWGSEARCPGGGGVGIACPADVGAGLVPRLQDTAVRAFEAVAGRGLARVDFFVTAGGAVIVDGLNAMPGFTRFSMFPKCWV